MLGLNMAPIHSQDAPKGAFLCSPKNMGVALEGTLLAVGGETKRSQKDTTLSWGSPMLRQAHTIIKLVGPGE